MATSAPERRRRPRSGSLRLSAEEYESIPESEEPLSSGIRLPRANPQPDGSSFALKNAPPPLPPKPSFARGSAIHNPAAPPPLPPKPENVRGEKIVDLPQRTRPATNFSLHRHSGTDFDEISQGAALLPPSRPVPAVPSSDRKPSYGEEGSWLPSNMDERSQFDPPFPPEPTIVSEGDLMRSSGGPVDTSTQSFIEHIPNLTLPLPLPPYSAQRYRTSSMFPPIPRSDQHEGNLTEGFLSLSISSAEDSQVGAVVLSQQRLKGIAPLPIQNRAPVKWRFYPRNESGGEAWSVLHEYLTNTALKAHGRNRALQLLTGYVVSACLEGFEAGYGLLSQIVRRMRGAERSERDGSIFTILINIAAHTSFVHKSSWASVEGVAQKVFSEVVEHMHGRQDDYVMWDRALRCFLVLLRASNRRPSERISSRCLSALALHVGDLTHTDVDHVLVNEGIYQRLYSLPDDSLGTSVDYGCMEEIGGLDTVLTIYTDTASSSVRQGLFRVIYDVAVRICLENTSQADVDILRDHIVTFRALLEVCEMSECFVHTFRVGPWPDFVMDTIRLLLFDPLGWKSMDSLTGRINEDSSANDRTVLREKAESSSISGTRLSGTIGRAYQSSVSRYVVSIRTMVRLLDKPFCLKVIQQLEKMAIEHAARLSKRETTHFAREWRILCEIESQLQRFIFSREEESEWSLTETLTKFYVATVDMTSGRCNLGSVLRLSEMIIDFFAVKVPFSKRTSVLANVAVDSGPKMFLKGQFLVSKELLEKANPSIFTLLLLATKTKRPSQRLSECRQCLIEFLGSNQKRVELLQPFVQEEDAAVAYRAGELVSKFPHFSEMTPDDAAKSIGQN
ncbi:unnamed protein product [Chondrus crispus]|uniref:Uncharacterized protein n=1 Tax=Chondrus crispus TaxID=2769 RepID=R7QFD0_CHOCR|nr:unnamed protein product [Chondrus crispus]CDF36151.1 unnamed protein product [Chondrus crispus]|eukprot:XP_005715970.1 unnamed protein product [Chondrus crispus]